MLNLDTHILLHALTGDLKPTERRVLSAYQWSISAMVLWEITKLAQLGRISAGLDDANVASALARVQVWPITVNVCRALGKLDFRADPVDEIIAATSLHHNVPLVTRDRNLLASRVVPLARL